MSIRKEKPADIEKIWNINAETFETDAEANLVNALRSSEIPFLSLVEVFMVLELKKNALKRIKGTVKYHTAFSNV